MWDWLAKGAQGLVDAGAKYTEYQQFIQGLFQARSEPEVLLALRDKVLALGNGEYLIFRMVLVQSIQQAEALVQQLEDRGWGSSYEDRMARMMAQIRTGQGPEEDAALAEARFVLQSLQQCLQVADALRNDPAARQQLDGYLARFESQLEPQPQADAVVHLQPAAEPEPEPESEPVPTADAGIDLSGMPVNGSKEDMYAWVRQMFEAERRRGRFDPAREQALSDLMQRLGGVIGRDAAREPEFAESEPDLAARKARLQANMDQVAELRGLIDEMRPMVRDIRTARPLPEGTRLARVARLLSDVQEHLMGALNVTVVGREAEQEALAQIYGRLAGLINRIRQGEGEDPWLVNLERDSLRSLMHKLRLFERRGHLMLASPIWSGWAVKPDVNFLLFAGPSETGELVREAARAVGLEVSAGGQPGADPALTGWKEAQRAGVAVFDLSEPDPQVYYQLGQIYALGTEVLLLCREGQRVPFDVAQDLVFYRDAADLKTKLPAALDGVLFGLQTRSIRTHMKATLDYCRRIAADSEDAAADNHMPIVLGQMQEAVGSPLAFHAALEQFLGQLGADALRILQPCWPASYPDPGKPRCFIVMPFDPRLALTQAIYQHLEARLRTAGVEPVRGDVAEGQDIIHSIWEETARATQVLVDLTGYNPNVCLELGMADTLGRPVLLIGEAGTEKSLFPAIAKRRCHTYGEDYADNPAFAMLIDTLIRGARGHA